MSNNDSVVKSITSIYAEILNRRKEDKIIKKENKRLEKELKLLESTEEINDNTIVLTKKEKQELKLNSWKDVIVGLTGEDLDYISPKKDKKKYKKWIDEDGVKNNISVEKSPKRKKKNYSKEFEPEINMLKSIVIDQNKFTVDLQKRYQTAAGPNTRDAMPLNKTLVELAAVINSSRNNSLGVLKEISNIKKTVADLYMKQFKIDSDGVKSDNNGFGNDLALMGSNLASSLFGDTAPNNVSDNSTPTTTPSFQIPIVTSSPTITQDNSIPQFNPELWDGSGMDAGNSKYEAIPHTIIVEWHKSNDKARFKVIRNDTGEEFDGCPVPTCSIKTIDEKNKMAKDEFNQVYKVEVI